MGMAAIFKGGTLMNKSMAFDSNPGCVMYMKCINDDNYWYVFA